MNKDTTFSIRIASGDLNIIKKKAKQARLSQSDYVTRCCLGRQVVVIEDLKETAKQLRAIGNHLNQLTELRRRNDQICAELGLPVFQAQKKKPVKSLSGAEYGFNPNRGRRPRLRGLKEKDPPDHYRRNP